MLRIRLTEKQLDEALKALTVQVDTRETKNTKQIKHITDWFDAKGIKYKKQKIDFGDFSAFIPKGTIKGIEQDIVFDRMIAIERKKSIDELAGNFSKKDNPRLKKEFAHLKAHGTKVFIFLEDALFDKHLRAHNYISQYEPQKLYARIKGFEAEYDTIIRPVKPEFMGSEIYHTLYYYVRNKLLREFNITIEEEAQE